MAKKTFIATVTPGEIQKRDTKAGVRYSMMPDAKIESKGPKGKMVVKTRTAMAFGRKNASVARVLRTGKPVQLVCSWDGGTLMIEGRVPAPAKAA
jgi:hypothetical protein